MFLSFIPSQELTVFASLSVCDKKETILIETMLNISPKGYSSYCKQET